HIIKDQGKCKVKLLLGNGEYFGLYLPLQVAQTWQLSVKLRSWVLYSHELFKECERLQLRARLSNTRNNEISHTLVLEQVEFKVRKKLRENFVQQAVSKAKIPNPFQKENR